MKIFKNKIMKIGKNKFEALKKFELTRTEIKNIKSFTGGGSPGGSTGGAKPRPVIQSGGPAEGGSTNYEVCWYDSDDNLLWCDSHWSPPSGPISIKS